MCYEKAAVQMRKIESERHAEALARACGLGRVVVVPKRSWLEWLTNGHDFDIYPHPAKKTLQIRLCPIVWWEEQRTLENIPTPNSPFPGHWEDWLANPVVNPAVEDGAESEEVEVVEDIEVDDSDGAEEHVTDGTAGTTTMKSCTTGS